MRCSPVVSQQFRDNGPQTYWGVTILAFQGKVRSSSAAVSKQVTTLGVTLDNNLTVDSHVLAVCNFFLPQGS